MIRIWITLGIVGMLGLAGWFGWSYYKNTEAEKARLLMENTQLEISLESEKKTREKLQEFQNNQVIFMDELADALADAEDPLRELESLFARHNLTILSLEKPSLIERRMNAATKKAFDDLECLTDSC